MAKRHHAPEETARRRMRQKPLLPDQKARDIDKESDSTLQRSQPVTESMIRYALSRLAAQAAVTAESMVHQVSSTAVQSLLVEANLVLKDSDRDAVPLEPQAKQEVDMVFKTLLARERQQKKGEYEGDISYIRGRDDAMTDANKRITREHEAVEGAEHDENVR